MNVERSGPGYPTVSRRRMLSSVAGGFGMLGLAAVMSQAQAQQPSSSSGGGGMSASEAPGALPARAPHHAPRAKRVIFLFMGGGPSHVDLFDPKPRLTADHGKPLPFEKP